MQRKDWKEKIQNQLKNQNKMAANCICCGDKVCTREVGFYPELGGYLCSYCERDEEIIQGRKEEVKFLENQNN